MKKILSILSLLLCIASHGQLMTMTSSYQVYYLNLKTASVYDIDNVDNIIIEGITITNHDIGLAGGNAIRMINCDNIIIRNCFFNGSIREAISAENCTNIIVENCFFNGNANGMYALNSTGIKFRRNYILNPHGARGGRGQAFQADACYGSGNVVEDNLGYGFKGEVYPEDWVSLVNGTSGTSGSPFMVRRNKFKGGGPSESGGGIMLGDQTGNYQTAEDNQLLYCGNYGVACSGGNNNLIQNNIIYDILRAWSNVGWYVANYAGEGTTCSNITVLNNKSTWTHKTNFSNPSYNSGDCSSTTVTGNTSSALSDFSFPTGRWFPGISDNDIYLLRRSNEPYRVNETTGDDDEFPPTPARPTAAAGSDATISITSTTLNGSGSTSSNGISYEWSQIAGPVKTTIVSPTASSTSVTGIATNGVYTYQLVVKEDAAGAGEANEFYRASDADRVTIIKQ